MSFRASITKCIQVLVLALNLYTYVRMNISISTVRSSSQGCQEKSSEQFLVVKEAIRIQCNRYINMDQGILLDPIWTDITPSVNTLN